jgi:ion channel
MSVERGHGGTPVTRIRAYLRPRRHSALLVAIILTFGVRPVIPDGRVATTAFSVALLVLMLVALYNIQVDELVGDREALLRQRRRRSLIGWLIVIPAIVDRVAIMLAPEARLLLLGAISWFAFFAFVTWGLLRSLLRHREVTGETISLSISVYLLIGLTWGVFYIVLHELQPDAFNLAGAAAGTPGSAAGEQRLFPIFVYFSLTTLATIGYGDIVPVSLQARYAAVAEGIAGQFYLAILVARLVGMHMSPAATRSEDQVRPPKLD